MRGLLLSVATLLASSGLTVADDGITYTVDKNDQGKLVFPKVKVGDTVRFFESASRAGGDIKVTATNGAKLEKSGPHEFVKDGRVLATGTKNMQFEVKATKAGKAKITVAIKNGAETQTVEYELEIE